MLATLGALAVCAYVHGVIQILDQPDKSWIFWGSVFFLTGLPLLGVGGFLILWGRSLLRASRRS